MAFVDRRFGHALPTSAPAPRHAAGRMALGEAAIEPPLPRNRARDLFALALAAGCVFLVAALATFDPADPPATQVFPPHARAVNACGLLGAIVAATMYQAFGLAAWVVVGMLACLDVMLLRRRPLPDLPIRAAGAVLAIVGGCTLLSLFLPDAVARPIWGPGGYAGATGKMFAAAYLNMAGAAIVVTAVTAAGLFIAADAAVLRLVAWCGMAMQAVAIGVGEVCGRLGSLWRPVAGARVDDDHDTDDLPDPAVEVDDEFPAIRVKRRDTSSMTDAADDDVDADPVDDDDEEELSDDAPAAVSPPAVPIKSRSSRKPVEMLTMSPDPAAEYELPSMDLLLPTEYLELDQQEQEVRDRARVLEKTFAEFGFKVKVVEIETGPVISQYEIELEAGLRLSKITNLADDLAIALRVPSVRIVAPIPGKNSVGIEVPNTTRQMVRLREVIEETQAKSRTMKIPIFLGKDVAGNPMVVDMASMPHLLIAGRTGTGKSVCLNSIIVSMLMTRRPDEVRMLMIDPKMVELTPYKSLPHLMHPVVTDMKKAEAILAWAVDKMEERYALLAKVGVRHLTQYNALGREEILKRVGAETDEEAAAIPTTMPFIVMIADEIADMMMTAGKEIEQYIIRLAQKSRAVGIHLILATQKPTVDVITGLIKSNLPARIAFQVASRTDSRVVLDEMGAERLLGNGDMLFLSPGTSQILRGQGTFLSDDEINRVMAAIGTSEPQYAAELVNLQPAPSGDAPKGAASGKDRDDLYEAAVEVIIREGRGSVSLLQRALGVGYGRGARLIDYMAEDGIVGQYNGSQAREVLITMEQWAERNGTQPVPADPAPRKLTIHPHGPVATPVIDEEIDAEDRETAEEDEWYDDDVDDESDDDADDDADDDQD